MKNKLEYKTSDKVRLQNGKIIPPPVIHPTNTNEKPQKPETQKK